MNGTNVLIKIYKRLIGVETPDFDADFLEDVKRKYGNSVIPLAKSTPPFELFKGGFGYKGVVLYDSEEDRVLCQICGKWKIRLNNKHMETHDMTIEEYKNKTGIFKTYPLSSIGSLTKSRQAGILTYPAKKAGLLAGQKKIDYSKRRMTNGKVTAMWKNSKGICDNQLRHRIADYARLNGREYRGTDDQALTSAIRRRFGTLERGMKIIATN